MFLHICDGVQEAPFHHPIQHRVLENAIRKNGAGEMAPWVKAPAAKSEPRSSITGTHREQTLGKAIQVNWFLHPLSVHTSIN